MWPHFTNLFWRTIHGMPLLVSSNWAAFGMGVGLFVLYHIFIRVFRGWDEMKRQWKENIGIGLLATLTGYLLLFAWSAVVTTYDEHHDSTGRWQAVVKEKDVLKAELRQRDGYIRTLENTRCPQCKAGPVGAMPAMEEKISSITVEARMTCTIKEDAQLPPSTAEIMAGFGTGQLIGVAGTAELARTNPVEFRKQRNNEMVVINHFYLPSSEPLMGSPVSRISNYDKLRIPITSRMFGRSTLAKLEALARTLYVPGDRPGTR